MPDIADDAQAHMEAEAVAREAGRHWEARKRAERPMHNFCEECGDSLPECRRQSRFSLCTPCQEEAERRELLRKIQGCGEGHHD